MDSNLGPDLAAAYWIRAEGARAECVPPVAVEDAELPMTLGLRGEPGQTLVVDVAAIPPGAGLPDPQACPVGAPPGATVHQRASARFTEDRRLLFMTLRAACAEVDCEAGRSCLDGICHDTDRGPLPPYDEELGFPSITDAGASMDAGVMSEDAGIADAGAPDAGMPDAGMPDAGMPDAGDPCPMGMQAITVDLPNLDDSLIADSGMLCAVCGGPDELGSEPDAEIGIGRGIFAFELPPVLSTFSAWGAAVSVTVRFHRDRINCPGCALDDTLTVRAMRPDFEEGTGDPDSGANWCRRISGACDFTVRWDRQGAGGAGDIIDASVTSVFVPAAADDFSVTIPARMFDSYMLAEPGRLAVQVRASDARDGSHVFNVATKESTDADPPLATATYCSAI